MRKESYQWQKIFMIHQNQRRRFTTLIPPSVVDVPCFTENLPFPSPSPLSRHFIAWSSMLEDLTLRPRSSLGRPWLPPQRQSTILGWRRHVTTLPAASFGVGSANRSRPRSKNAAAKRRTHRCKQCTYHTIGEQNDQRTERRNVT